ncbi:MAG: hypothetical protein VW870_10440, partial [Rhodobiaceae bacterium]
MMVSDGSGSGQIEVDGVMSRPSDPMLCNTENVCVSAPIAFSVRKSFWKKFLGNGGTSGTSVVFVEQFSAHFGPFVPLDSEQIRLRDPLL